MLSTVWNSQEGEKTYSILVQDNNDNDEDKEFVHHYKAVTWTKKKTKESVHSEFTRGTSRRRGDDGDKMLTTIRTLVKEQILIRRALIR